MSNINYLVGDATSPTTPGVNIIVHVCNDIGAWGAGFVLAISKRWRQPEQRYREWSRRKDGFELGAVQLVEVKEGLFVANMIAQHGIRRGKDIPIRYEAVQTALEKVAMFAVEKSAKVHMPRIGCGLAGGTWDRIEPILKDVLLRQGVEVYVYDMVNS